MNEEQPRTVPEPSPEVPHLNRHKRRADEARKGRPPRRVDRNRRTAARVLSSVRT